MGSLDEIPVLALGTEPIAGPESCGGDITEDEQYIFVQAELSKLDRIEADEPDWYGIEQAAGDLLRHKSKDVEMAAALGAALFKRCRYEGLAAWMALTTALVNNFWDGLFPDRPRRRKARIETVTDLFAEKGWFGEHPPNSTADFDALDRCAARIDELDAALAARMPDDPPEFKNFKRRLKEWCEKRPKAASAQAPAGAAPSGGPGGPAAGASFAGGEVADRGSALSAVLSAASFLRTADNSDPAAYALVRAVKWSKIELPTSDAARYEIEPPEASTVETLEHQFGKQLWENLLKNAEAAFRTTDPLWLDLQRYVCAALRGLGATHAKAHDAVIGALAALVRRLGDGLFDLKFKGGRALCSGETRMWIESEVASGGGEAKPRSASSANGKLSEATNKARQLVGAGKLKEALTALHAGLSECTQRRDRFLWRLQIAQLCFEAQRLQLAGPLLEECYQDIKRFGIDDWEPTLAVDVAQTLYRCRKALLALEKSPTPENLEKVRNSFTWLCQLDPVAALAAEPSGK
jgi:type VI secretion system protein VasJ